MGESGRRDDEDRHRDEAEHEPRQRGSQDDRPGGDRCREQPAQGAELAIGEHGQGAVLGGEEHEHDRHRRAIERGEVGLEMRGRRIDRRDRCRRADRGLGGGNGCRVDRSPVAAVVATISWTAPTSSAKRVTADRATSRDTANSPPRIRIVAGWPVATAALNPAGMMIAAPARPARTSSAAAASVGRLRWSPPPRPRRARPGRSLTRMSATGPRSSFDDDELRVERRELVRDQDREREGQAERGQDREDDRRAVADALAQDPAGDHQGGPHRMLRRPPSPGGPCRSGGGRPPRDRAR